MKTLRIAALTILTAACFMISAASLSLPVPKSVEKAVSPEIRQTVLSEEAYETYASPALTAFGLTYTKDSEISIDFAVSGNSSSLFFYVGLQSKSPSKVIDHHMIRLSEINSSPEDITLLAIEFNLKEYNLSPGDYSLVYAIVDPQFRPVDENQQVVSYFYGIDMTIVNKAIPITQVTVTEFSAEDNPAQVTNTTLCVDNYNNFMVSILPENASGNRIVECISSDPDVVLGYSYLGLACIQGVNPGTATITVTVDGEHAQTIKVTVTSHDYDYELINETTCEEDGIEKFHCSLCDFEYIETTPATGHNYISNPMIVTKENTATREGAGYRVCNNCGEQIPFTIPAIFIDTDPTGYYCDGIDFCYDKGITKGAGEDIFSPNAAVTRGMVVTFLYRLSGQPEYSTDVPFSDVPEDHMFYDAIAWAYENGITSGTDMNTFLPGQNITREQLATFIFRYVDYMDSLNNNYKEIGSFPDHALTASYAKAAMSWVVANGIISGTNYDGILRLSPQDTATRAQTTTMIYRLANYLENHN